MCLLNDEAIIYIHGLSNIDIYSFLILIIVFVVYISVFFTIASRIFITFLPSSSSSLLRK